MKFVCQFNVLFVIASMSILLAEPRKFTNKDGREIEAELLRVSSDWKEVTIRSNGQEFSIVPTTLSLDDQQYIKDWLKGRGITGPSESSSLDIEVVEEKPVSDVDRYEEIINKSEAFTLRLRAGDVIDSAIPVGKRSIKIEIAEVDRDEDGILFKLGRAFGVVLKVEDGLLTFSRMNGGKDVVSVEKKLLSPISKVSAILNDEGISLGVNNYIPITDKKGGLLPQSPSKGITIGESVLGELVLVVD